MPEPVSQFVEMINPDYRRVMSVSDFEAIEMDDEHPIDSYYEALIDRNKRLDHHFFEEPEALKKLTPGQRMLLQLGTFDGQVKNGGITQFFWNCPEYLFDVGDWIQLFALPQLQSNYDRALEALVGKKERWLDLRKECYKIRDNPSWDSFRQAYELLDLDWFDKAYFDTHGYNQNREWVREKRGLHYALLTRIADYVRTNRDEFITK